MEEPVGARPSVVIVGAGFGGLRVARGLSRAPVDVTILDRHNYHTFVPLLYQVATAGLEPEEIAQPIRRILRGVPNVRFRLNTVMGVDLDRRAVITDAGEVRYDYLVLAAGSTTSYFGLDSLAQVTSALRDLDDAERLRDQVLGAFEAASAEEDPSRRRQLMTLIVVGGGPTGVELAGALADGGRRVGPAQREQPEEVRGRGGDGDVARDGGDRLHAELGGTPREQQGERIVDARVEDGQLDDADLTLKNIAQIKEAFVQQLLGMYHSRIKYPDQVPLPQSPPS